jgi:carbon-monoxide dehydrogenase medium subunit
MHNASPGLPSFEYIRAETCEEASALLLEYPGEARLFMGGTDIFVRMRDGVLSAKILIDVKDLPGMTRIEYDPQHGLSIGAAVDMNTMACHPAVIDYYPLLAEAAQTVASYQLRTRATMGGNLCNASPAADTAPSALVLEAQMIVCSSKGERVIPITEFFLGPGKTALQPGEFLLRIEFPPMPDKWAGHYLKLGRNRSGDLAIVGAAVLGYPDTSVPSGYRFRLALASVAPTPIRVPDAENILAQGPISSTAFDKAAAIARSTAKPISDLRGTAAYRQAMVEVQTRRALQSVWEGLQ